MGMYRTGDVFTFLTERDAVEKAISKSRNILPDPRRKIFAEVTEQLINSSVQRGNDHTELDDCLSDLIGYKIIFDVPYMYPMKFSKQQKATA